MLLIALGFVSCVILLISIAALTPPEEASPDKALSERDVYYPGTEDLEPDEMRVVALGTGMPNARPKQAAACWLVELGNGDKFLFDIGDGSVERLFGLQIPTAFLDKVFIGHLHGDHFGGSRWKWNYTHRYRFQNNDWQLIGATINYGTPCDYSFTFDYNLSTGNIIYEKDTEFCNDTTDQVENVEKEKPQVGIT